MSNRSNDIARALRFGKFEGLDDIDRGKLKQALELIESQDRALTRLRMVAEDQEIRDALEGLRPDDEFEASCIDLIRRLSYSRLAREQERVVIDAAREVPRNASWALAQAFANLDEVDGRLADESRAAIEI
jgi:hypothetical protein